MPRQSVSAPVVEMTGMALDPVQRHLMAASFFIKGLPQFGVLNRLLIGSHPSVALPAENPFRNAILHVGAIGIEIDFTRLFQKAQGSIAAISSIRLLVVSASPPQTSFSMAVESDLRQQD